MWDLINLVIPKVKASWINLELFEDWLTTGHGCTPKTWQTLLQRIKRVNGLTAAANEIKEQLSNEH